MVFWEGGEIPGYPPGYSVSISYFIHSFIFLFIAIFVFKVILSKIIFRALLLEYQIWRGLGSTKLVLKMRMQTTVLKVNANELFPNTMTFTNTFSASLDFTDN